MKFDPAIVLATLVFSFQAGAELQFEKTEIYLPLKGSTATAGYARIVNPDNKDIKISITDAEGFKASETHETFENQGRMEMKKIEAFSIPAHSSLELKPGGKHIMLFAPDSKVQEGAVLPIKFRVGERESLLVPFKVVPRLPAKSSHEATH